MEIYHNYMLKSVKRHEYNYSIFHFFYSFLSIVHKFFTQAVIFEVKER